MMIRIAALPLLFVWVLAAGSSQVSAQDKFYNYYDKGLKYMEKKDWLRAVQEFKSAISIEFEDNNTKRTYGTKFIDYFPHRELGVAYFELGDMQLAKQELELSIAYASSKKAREYLSRLGSGQTVATGNTQTAVVVLTPSKEELEKVELEKKKLKEQQEKLDEERRLAEKAKKEEKEKLALRQKELEEQKRKIEEQQAKLEAQKKLAAASSASLVAAGLLYDASLSPQVGSRLSIAVLPFESKGDAQGLGEGISEKMITQLVNLRRFKVIERSQIEKVIKEQDFQLTDVADVSTVAKVGKIIGADVIVLGSVNIVTGFAKVNARVIDVETAETIVAREKESQATDLASIEQKVAEIAVMIYNDIPLQEGYVISVEQDQSVLIDIGTTRGIRKGTKCVVFREGADIIHPITKQSLGKKRTLVAELVVTQGQDQFSISSALETKDKIQVGDKVLVK